MAATKEPCLRAAMVSAPSLGICLHAACQLPAFQLSPSTVASAFPVLHVQLLLYTPAAGLVAETQNSALNLHRPQSHLEAPKGPPGSESSSSALLTSPWCCAASPRTSLWEPLLRRSFCDPRACTAPGSATSPAVNRGSLWTSFLVKQRLWQDTSPGEHKKEKVYGGRTWSAGKGEGQQPSPDSVMQQKADSPPEVASFNHVVLFPPFSSEAENWPSVQTHPLCSQLPDVQAILLLA